eukprot:scaffold18122_cov194-Amphora_coffeaeformis.AAC.1
MLGVGRCFIILMGHQRQQGLQLWDITPSRGGTDVVLPLTGVESPCRHPSTSKPRLDSGVLAGFPAHEILPISNTLPKSATHQNGPRELGQFRHWHGWPHIARASCQTRRACVRDDGMSYLAAEAATPSHRVWRQYKFATVCDAVGDRENSRGHREPRDAPRALVRPPADEWHKLRAGWNGRHRLGLSLSFLLSLPLLFRSRDDPPPPNCQPWPRNKTPFPDDGFGCCSPPWWSVTVEKKKGLMLLLLDAVNENRNPTKDR